jgi:thiamine phosphate synthase YjbQ (UPF0047 family)
MNVWFMIIVSFINIISTRSFPVTVNRWRERLQRDHRKRTKAALLPMQSELQRRQNRSVRKLAQYFMKNDEREKRDHEHGISGTAASTTSPAESRHQHHLGLPMCLYDQITIPVKSLSSAITDDALGKTETAKNEVVPQQEIIIYDITKQIQQFLSERCRTIQCGTITLYNRHTTTSLIINEYESRLLRDMQNTFLQLIQPDVRSFAYQKAQQMGDPFPDTARYYEHNDIHLRPESLEETLRCYENGYNISDPVILQSWRDSEPINAHSHLLSMIIGSPTLTIPIHNSTLQIGTWQSIMLIDFDGPRLGRTVGIQVMGYQ